MKNVPIDQFWSFKWRNGVQNWNLREKLSKIGPVGNFDFWSKVNAKVKVNCLGSKSTVSANGSDPCSPVRVGPGQWSARWHGADEATLLTWLADVSRANVDVLAWLLTWSDDVIRWRQQQCFGAWQQFSLSLSLYIVNMVSEPFLWLSGSCGHLRRSSAALAFIQSSLSEASHRRHDHSTCNTRISTFCAFNCQRKGIERQNS